MTTPSIYGAPPMDTEPGTFHHIVAVEGAGAADPTRLVGRTCNVVRNGAVGKYKVTWPAGPGYFVDWKPSFQATTPSDVKGYHAVVGDFHPPTDSAQAYIEVWVYDSAGNLDDLEAGWKLRLEFTFRTVNA